LSYARTILEVAISHREHDIEKAKDQIQAHNLEIDKIRGAINESEARIAELRRALKLLK